MAKYKKLLVTGTGRSGTKYMQQILNLSGIKCGHESVFSLAWAQSINKRPFWGQYKADSSWLAAPLVSGLSQDILIVHLVREPLPTIRSMTERETFKRFNSGNPYLQWLLINGFKPDYGSAVRSAAKLYLWLNEYIEPFAEFRMMAEHVTPAHLYRIADLLGLRTRSLTDYSETLHRTPHNVHKSILRSPDLEWDDIPPRERRPLARMALDYGYDYPLE